MFIELHILQNFAPSNLNRDDTGTPKDCEFGGVRRARISSQCIKRAIRETPIFAQTTRMPIGIRTKWVARNIYEGLLAHQTPEARALELANEFTTEFSKKTEKSKESQLQKTLVLIFFSPEEIDLAVAGLLEGRPAADLAAELIKSSKNRSAAPDIALFGRMLADAPVANVDAACQVAHALSTHAVNMETDFYTAVDEMNREGETGAGMMGTIGFNSATFYRYARIDFDLLVRNLGGDRNLARATVEGFMRASLAAIPTGKQNSHAAQNPPSLALAVVREDGDGWSLANAFEKPIYAGREGGLVEKSARQMTKYWKSLNDTLGGVNVQPFVLAIDPCLQETDALQGFGSQAIMATREAWVGQTVSALQD